MDGFYDVVVIGAGAAGISAGRRLAKAGVSFAVLEARDRIGGRSHTVVRDGLAIDLGCGWLHSAEHNVMAPIAEASGSCGSHARAVGAADWSTRRDGRRT